MSTASAYALLGLPVQVGELRVGVVEDVVLGADLGVVLGLVVKAISCDRRFLPWAAARITTGESVLAAAATLLGELELDYYVQSGVRLRRLATAAVDDPEDRELIVDDVLFGADGHVVELALTDGGAQRRVALEDTRVRRTARRALVVSVVPETRELAPAPVT